MLSTGCSIRFNLSLVFELYLITMASAEENIILSRLLDLFREDPDRIRSFLQAGTSRESINPLVIKFLRGNFLRPRMVAKKGK